MKRITKEDAEAATRKSCPCSEVLAPKTEPKSEITPSSSFLVAKDERRRKNVFLEKKRYQKDGTVKNENGDVGTTFKTR